MMGDLRWKTKGRAMGGRRRECKKDQIAGKKERVARRKEFQRQDEEAMSEEITVEELERGNV